MKTIVLEITSDDFNKIVRFHCESDEKYNELLESMKEGVEMTSNPEEVEGYSVEIEDANL